MDIAETGVSESFKMYCLDNRIDIDYMSTSDRNQVYQQFRNNRLHAKGNQATGQAGGKLK